jgi:hypothetical protein
MGAIGDPITVNQPVEVRMNLETDLAALLAKHKSLESELADAIVHPAASDQEIAAIKRQKLKLKDLIASLQRSELSAA